MCNNQSFDDDQLLVALTYSKNTAAYHYTGDPTKKTASDTIKHAILFSDCLLYKDSIIPSGGAHDEIIKRY